MNDNCIIRKTQESPKKQPSQQDFWRELRAEPDFELRQTQARTSLPPIVPGSYPTKPPK